jgi:hypothetical protein
MGTPNKRKRPPRRNIKYELRNKTELRGEAAEGFTFIMQIETNGGMMER